MELYSQDFEDYLVNYTLDFYKCFTKIFEECKNIGTGQVKPKSGVVTGATAGAATQFLPVGRGAVKGAVSAFEGYLRTKEKEKIAKRLVFADTKENIIVSAGLQIFIAFEAQMRGIVNKSEGNRMALCSDAVHRAFSFFLQECKHSIYVVEGPQPITRGVVSGRSKSGIVSRVTFRLLEHGNPKVVSVKNEEIRISELFSVPSDLEVAKDGKLGARHPFPWEASEHEATKEFWEARKEFLKKVGEKVLGQLLEPGVIGGIHNIPMY